MRATEFIPWFKPDASTSTVLQYYR